MLYPPFHLLQSSLRFSSNAACIWESFLITPALKNCCAWTTRRLSLPLALLKALSHAVGIYVLIYLHWWILDSWGQRQLFTKLCLLHSTINTSHLHVFVEQILFLSAWNIRTLHFTFKIEHFLKQNLQCITLNIVPCWKQKNNTIYFYVITPDLKSKNWNF